MVTAQLTTAGALLLAALLPGGVPTDGKGMPPAVQESRPRGPLDDAEARRAAAEKRAQDAVMDAIHRAKYRVFKDPDDAFQSLKRELEDVRDNPDLGPAVKSALEEQLISGLRTVASLGRAVKRVQSEVDTIERRIAAVDSRIALREQRQQDGPVTLDQLRERMELEFERVHLRLQREHVKLVELPLEWLRDLYEDLRSPPD